MLVFKGALGLRWLRHLERVRESLDAWRQRVREALAQVVSDAATKAVREAVQTLAGAAEPDVPPTSWSRPAEEYRRAWSEPARPAWSSYSSSSWEREEQEYDAPDEEVEELPTAVSMSPMAATDLSPPAHRSRALALGLQAAAWWLRRRAARFPLRSALGLGTLATVVAYLAGPAVALSSVGLIGATLTCCL
jgi:hypothetical protein